SNLLFSNQESGRFADVTATAGVAGPPYSFPTWFWDYDNDGWQDIFVAGFKGEVADVAAAYLGLPHRAEEPRLYRNNGDGTFTDVTRKVRLDEPLIAMGSNFGDLDNDGYQDCYIGTGDPYMATLVPNRMFRNADGNSFQDVTTSGGFGHLQKGHGVAFGDIDHDGDQDVFSVIGGAFTGDVYQNVLFANPGHGNHWIKLRLEGRRTNRSAIGVRVKVSVNTASGSRDIYSTVTSGGSFGASSLQCEIGLGQAESIQAIEIVWPASGEVQIFNDVEMDQYLYIREGDSHPTRRQFKSFAINPSNESDGMAHNH
ncbi:MAG: CRTAC1 family protein, partial [Gemmatimonadetes bacterium]|nr:CRTAC1 family protein [Gemmatimonadota bacterium]